jgi:hypothetical protein
LRLLAKGSLLQVNHREASVALESKGLASAGGFGILRTMEWYLLPACSHRTKQPVVEPRESSAFNAAADDYRAKLANPAYSGAVFFAVMRWGGKLRRSQAGALY